MNAMDYATEEAKNRLWASASLERGEEGQRVKKETNGSLYRYLGGGARDSRVRVYGVYSMRGREGRELYQMYVSSFLWDGIVIFTNYVQSYNSAPDSVGRQRRGRSPIR